MTKTFTLSLLALLVFPVSCKKLGPDGLPPATRSGLGTFGCRINGKPFHNDDYFLTGRSDLNSLYAFNYHTPVTHDSVEPYPSGWLFYVNATNYKKNLISVHITTDSLIIAEHVPFPIGTRRAGAASAVLFGQNDADIFGDSTSDLAQGALVFTRVDTAAKVISGNFYFDVISPSAGDTIHITDGRFDLLYNPAG